MPCYRGHFSCSPAESFCSHFTIRMTIVFLIKKRNKKLLGAPGRTTRSKDGTSSKNATGGKGHRYKLTRSR